MRPSYAPNDSRDLGLVYAKLVGDGLLTVAPNGIELPYALYCGSIENRRRCALSPRRVLWCSRSPDRMPAFSRAVGCVVRVRTKKQVVQSHARGVVARMADQQTLGDRTVGHFPSNAVCTHMLTVREQLSIASRADVAINPTTVAFGDVPPEPLLDSSHAHFVGAGATTEPPLAGFHLMRERVKHCAARFAVGSDARVSHADNLPQVGAHGKIQA